MAPDRTRDDRRSRTNALLTQGVLLIFICESAKNTHSLHRQSATGAGRHEASNKSHLTPLLYLKTTAAVLMRGPEARPKPGFLFRHGMQAGSPTLSSLSRRLCALFDGEGEVCDHCSASNASTSVLKSASLTEPTYVFATRPCLSTRIVVGTPANPYSICDIRSGLTTGYGT